MRKIFLLSSIFMLAFSSCQDVNDGFDWLDGATKPVNKSNYTLTISPANITTIVSATKGTDNAAYGTQLQKDGMFSDAAPAETLIPYALASLYFSADQGSSASVTYNFKVGRNETVAGLSTAPYALTDNDYKLVWGDNYVSALTPEKSPEKSIPTILAKNIESPTEGMFKNVEFYYSKEEPITSTVEKNLLEETFEGYPAGSGVPVAINGWINKDLTGSFIWQNRTYSNNNYAQVSSYNSKGVNDVVLITKGVDLVGTSNPKFSFDISVGNFTASCLSIQISEDFDGKEANIKNATWKDVTSSFTIPQPASGYSTWASAGTLDLKAYKGKKIYVCFKYNGDDTSTPKKTTTYQIDNIKVYDQIVGLTVVSKELQYAAYEYKSAKWQLSTALTLQPADYEAMGMKFLTSTQAPNYVPTYLAEKFPYAQEGNVKNVVYKTSATACYADEFVFEGGKWTANTFIVEKTGQFILSSIGWVFDPTFNIVMVKGNTTGSDYMLVVDYVKKHLAVETPALINKYGDAEYYYGFTANYGNITFRETDRKFDPTYPISGTDAEKLEFCEKRAIEGLNIFLGEKYPNATPLVNGIEQKAKVTTVLYYGPAQSNMTTYEYEFQCVGNKEWKYLNRVAK